MNIFSDKTYNNKPIINSNNANREAKLKQNASEFTFDNKKDTSLNSSGNICKITNNNIFNNSNIYEYQQMRNTTINSIDDKYKNLENPFTNPEIPRRPEEERRARIFERIRKSQYQSKSVDSVRNQHYLYSSENNISKEKNEERKNLIQN